MTPKLTKLLSTCGPSLCWIKCMPKDKFLEFAGILRIADITEVPIIFEQACTACGVPAPGGGGAGGDTEGQSPVAEPPVGGSPTPPPTGGLDVPELPSTPVDYSPPGTESVPAPSEPEPSAPFGGANEPPVLSFKPRDVGFDPIMPQAPAEPYRPDFAPFVGPTTEKVKIKLSYARSCDAALDAWRKAEGASALRRILSMCMQIASNDPDVREDIDDVLRLHPSVLPAYMTGPYATGDDNVLALCSARAVSIMTPAGPGYSFGFVPAMRGVATEARFLGRVVAKLLTDQVVTFRHAYALEAARLRFAARATARSVTPYGLYSDNSFRTGLGYPGGPCSGPAEEQRAKLAFSGHPALAAALSQACARADLHREICDTSPLLGDLLGWLTHDLLPTNVLECLRAAGLDWLAIQDSQLSGGSPLSPLSPLALAIAASLRMTRSGGVVSIDEIGTLAVAAGARPSPDLPAMRALDEPFIDVFPAARGADTDRPAVVTARMVLTSPFALNAYLL